MAKDNKFEPDFRGCADCSAVTEQFISAATLQLVAENPRSSANSRWAFLVNAGLIGGLLELYKSCLKYVHLQIFTKRTEAMNRLNERASPEQKLN